MDFFAAGITLGSRSVIVIISTVLVCIYVQTYQALHEIRNYSRMS